MKAFGRFVAVLAVLGMVGSARAGYCGGVYQSYPGYYYPSYAPTYNYEVKKFTILEFVQPFFVGVPGVYAAPPAPAAAVTVTPCEEVSRKLQARIDALEAKVGGTAPVTYAPRDNPPPMAPVTSSAPGREIPKKSVVQSRCASCHDVSTASSKGKGVVLTVGGSYSQWTPELTGKVLKEVSTAHMPKGGQLPPEDFTGLLQELVDMQGK